MTVKYFVSASDFIILFKTGDTSFIVDQLTKSTGSGRTNSCTPVRLDLAIVPQRLIDRHLPKGCPAESTLPKALPRQVCLCGLQSMCV